MRMRPRTEVTVLVGVALFVLCCMAVPGQSAVRSATVGPVADSGLYGSTDQDRANRGTGGRMDIGSAQSALVKFDIAPQLAADECVLSATLQLYTARQGYTFTQHVVAYPLAAAWQEGVGNAGAVGDLGFPWGPASIGDAVWLYQRTTAVGLGTGGFASILVATDGVPWNVAGGRGVGTDVLDRLMIDSGWVKSVSTEPVGTALAPLPLTADGAAVIRGWCTGTLENNGMNIWATSATNYAAPTSREFGTASARPALVLTIGYAGDLNADGGVDVVDLLILVDSFGVGIDFPAYDPNCDLNGDGAVDVVDLLMFVENFGKS